MGKPTGFMEYRRIQSKNEPALERIKHFNEFHPTLSVEERQRQGARCMDCGVPFCQSAIKLNGMVTGCPLHNLIPEWNDEIYNGSFDEAAGRLLKTNCFPEFTGRVCPKLCEKACVCAKDGDAVTIRENELFIIENAFESGIIKPEGPAVRTDKKVAVIGSGPAGLATAQMLNRRGHNVTVYERDDRIGGLLMYGIPNMKLEKRIVERRIKLMEAEGVRFVTGADIGRNISASEILDKFSAVAICCGAKKPRSLSGISEQAEGVHFAVDYLSNMTKYLLDGREPSGFVSAKGKHVVIVGGGDTGNDCVGTAIRQGCKSVVQIEIMPQLPLVRPDTNPWPQWPLVSKTDYGQEEAAAVFGRDPRIFNTTVKELITENGVLKGVKTVQVRFDENRRLTEIAGTEKTVEADLLLIAAGFLGCENYVAEAFGVELSEGNTVKTGGDGYKTSVEGVFAAGDVRRGQSLVVWAIAEGRACAKEIDKYLMGYSNMI
ncbi:MAG: glutamate synthase subunit beta [Eubacteriales bacterium]|nr:glutamate synthase subunit beta [Eubacteriales bacterium]